MAGDKTEKATPKRKQDERKKGNVLMSKDAVAVATLIGSLFMVFMMRGIFLDRIGSLINLCFSHMATGGPDVISESLAELKGAKISAHQAEDIARLAGVKII